MATVPKLDLDWYGTLVGPDSKDGPSVGPMVLAVKRVIERWDPSLLPGTFGSIDDVYNRKTVSAVMRMQKEWGLNPSGKWTKETHVRSLRALREKGERKPVELAWDSFSIALWKKAKPRVPAKRCYLYPASVDSTALAGVADHMTRPLGNWQSDHAIDEHAPAGSIVVAIKPGRVSRGGGVDPHRGPVATIFGEHVTVECDDGTAFFITHVDRLVTVGERVVAGEILGRVGDWPRSSAMDHTHLGARGFNPEDVRRWPRIKLPYAD